MRVVQGFGLVGLLVSVAAAMPLEKRAYKWVTETHYEVVDVTVTVTVAANAPSTTTTTSTVDAATSTTTPTPTPTPEAVSSTTSSPSEYSWSWSESTTSTSTSTTSTPEPPVEEVPPTSTTVPPPPPSSPSSSPPPPPAPTPESVPKEQPVVKVQEAPKYEAAPETQSSGEGEFHGELTHYDTDGLGSCGWTNDGTSEFVVALSTDVMGNPPGGNPNKHPNCGKKIKVHHDGKTLEATVVDTCGACASHDVDLSMSLFESFAGLGVGRMDGTWEWA